MAEAGRGVRKNVVVAASWYMVAGREGNLGALRRLEALDQNLSASQRQAAQERALAWEQARAGTAR